MTNLMPDETLAISNAIFGVALTGGIGLKA